MKELVIIKLGGSVITDKSKPYTARKTVIARIAKELSLLTVPYIIIHGSGSFGHTSAKKYGGKKGYVSKIGVAHVAKDAVAINAIVMEELLQQNIPAITLHPTSMFLAKGGEKEKAFFKPLQEVLKQDLVPVLYGDVIWDTEWKTTIFSGEKIASLLVPFLQKKGWQIKIVQLTNTNGVLDNTKQTIPSITQKNWSKIKKHIYATDDATGGMLHKIETSLELTEKHIPTIIINGNTAGELLRTIKGKKVRGTVITFLS